MYDRRRYDNRAARKRLMWALKEARKGKFGDRLTTLASGACCDSCMQWDIDSDNPAYAGMASWSVQADKGWAEYGELYINFDRTPDSPYTVEQIGKRIVHHLRRAMLDVQWNGSGEYSIIVKDILPEKALILDPTTGSYVETRIEGHREYFDAIGQRYLGDEWFQNQNAADNKYGRFISSLTPLQRREYAECGFAASREFEENYWRIHTYPIRTIHRNLEGGVIGDTAWRSRHKDANVAIHEWAKEVA